MSRIESVVIHRDGQAETGSGSHLQAILWLLGSTVLVCCVLYPLYLWGIATTVFRSEAEGSLIYGPDGKAIGSRLIAQPFSGDEYFQPRPSAASYNGAAAGATNWGANNPKLRDRVARTLGPIARYAEGPQMGELVGPDIEKWFASRTDPKNVTEENPDLVTSWSSDYPTLASNWVKQDAAAGDYVKQWAEHHPEVLEEWKNANPDASSEPKPEDLATQFFASFAKVNPGKWPILEDVKTPEGKTEKKVKLVTEGSDLQSTFFDLWLQAHPKAELEKVPADMVMASGSGLDPHITVKNAHYQARRVAEARAKRVIEAREKKDGKPLTTAQRDEVTKKTTQQIEQLINKLAARPMGDLVIAGEQKIVNVLELNIALDKEL
jgi:K+-transporting ATPase ATPase C chain